MKLTLATAVLLALQALAMPVNEATSSEEVDKRAVGEYPCGHSGDPPCYRSCAAGSLFLNCTNSSVSTSFTMAIACSLRLDITLFFGLYFR